MIFGILLLISAGLLSIYNTLESNKIENDNLDTVTQLENIYDQDVQNDSQNNDQISENINKNNQNLLSNGTSIKIKGNNYIGIIYIPGLNNLALPVIENCSEKNLKISICKYYGSLKENNLVIAGHNYKSSFGKLSRLTTGSLVYFKDASGNIYKYHCKKIETLSPKSVREMVTGDWDLTLFTCTYDGTNRVAYRFEL